MSDRTRPWWRSLILHAALLAGSVVFALPYLWLVGTSWKVDREIQSAEFRILPRRPLPARASPYLSSVEFPGIARPEHVDAQRWESWLHRVLLEMVDARVAAFSDPRTAGLPDHALREVLRRGACQRLRNLIGPAVWHDADEPAFREAVGRVLTPRLIADCFNQAYRYFAVGQIKLLTHDYQVHDLTGHEPVEKIWQITAGPARLEQGSESERPVALVHYDFDRGGDFTLEATFHVPCDLGDPLRGFKRLDVSYRNDETWHELRVVVDMNGRRYRAAEPHYLGDDQWAEVQYQLPGPDDQRLIPHRYILLQEVRPDPGDPPADLGPHGLRVRLTMQPSSMIEALWAKGTENYRRAFDEVPFWRYFKTSVFLVVANVLGMMLSCSLAAYAFARLNWPGRDLCFILVLATLMIPPQVTMIPSFVIYKYLGWYNTLAPLWVPNCLAVNGFGIFLLRQAMKGIPRDLEEAARIDGCGHLRIYWSIVLPLVRPTLAAISIFTFMFVWNDFMTPLVYVNDQQLYPLALGLFSFMIGRENQFTLIMAGSVIMTLPVIIIFFLAQRHFIQGVTMSGMKN